MNHITNRFGQLIGGFVMTGDEGKKIFNFYI